MMKEVAIWGAGRIGRSFIADMFTRAGYHITFVDPDKKKLSLLRSRGQSPIEHFPAGKKKERRVISGFEAIHTGDKAALEKIFSQTSLMVVAVFPDAFDSLATIFADQIKKRVERNNNAPLDIINCANTAHPSGRFREALYSRLSAAEAKHAEKFIGLVDMLIMRIAVDPGEAMKESGPLGVITNGYTAFPVDVKAFRGAIPYDVAGLHFSERMEAEKMRKRYTYNMVHAVFAYAGSVKGFQSVAACVQDQEIMDLAGEALREVALGLQAECCFTHDEMEVWNREVIRNLTNPMLEDSLSRLGADPVRKLGREDRLVGPALLCRKNGVLPFHLAKITAVAFLYDDKKDPGSRRISSFLKDHQIEEAIAHFCGLHYEKDLTALIRRHFENARDKKNTLEDPRRIALMKAAYRQGFHYEKTYRGCGQCTLGALFEMTGKREDMLFQASSALSGGMALSGDGACGGYTGGLLFLGTFAGRRWKHIAADKENQHKAYELSGKLREKFLETYGSIICRDIQKQLFGKSFQLNNKEVREEFEKAGAHRDKCTSVVGMAAMWVVEILFETNEIFQCISFPGDNRTH